VTTSCSGHLRREEREEEEEEQAEEEEEEEEGDIRASKNLGLLYDSFQLIPITYVLSTAP
jgi:hypothetical protein